MRPSQLTLSCALIALAALPSACSDGDSVSAIESTRLARSTGELPRATSAQRFGMSKASPGAADSAQSSGPSTSIAWTLPDGWEELPPTAMRLGNFAAPGGVDCSITTLSGSAGGLHSNVNRWRGQMGLDELSAADIDALPQQDLLGGRATKIDFTGRYGGMSGDVAEGEARMLGAILSEGARTVFVKLVGPKSAVDGQVRHFDGLVASMEAAALTGHEGHDHAPNDQTAHRSNAPDDAAHAGVPRGPVTEDPHGGSEAGLLVRELGGTNPLGLSWRAPAGWKPGPVKTMRMVTLVPDAAPDVECYVIVLSGDAGGPIANVNLWRSQMGLDGWSAAELEAADTFLQFDGLGRAGLRVELEGQGAAAGRGMFGVLCPLESHTVFIKLIGPADQLSGLRDDFISFCKSLER